MLNNLIKTTHKKKKRVGRGYGSGKGGHTTGRGTKGQKARYFIPLEFEGTARGGGSIKRYPYLRGKGKFKAYNRKPIIISLEKLNSFNTGEKVTIDTLIKKGLIEEKDAKRYGVKIVCNGTLEKKLTVLVPVSKSSQKKIEVLGGSIS